MKESTVINGERTKKKKKKIFKTTLEQLDSSLVTGYRFIYIHFEVPTFKIKQSYGIRIHVQHIT